MNLPATLIQAFAPTGALRASINLGNPLLARRDAATGQAVGVSVDLARGLAERLGVALELVVFEKAIESVQAVAEDRADIGFFAIDPLRGQEIAFTAPYLLIEGSYLVRADSPLQSNDEVDRPGQRVVVGQGSAYDLYLTRTLHQAEIVRAPNSQAVVQQFLAQGQEVAAGVRQQLEADAAGRPGLRLLPGRFMVIAQAMGLAKARGPEATAALAAYVEDMKASGFVAGALLHHGVEGASVAP
ncbi:transporter substrate-binding domain-containing protein [Ramlibacter sp. 2FC]|uniref:transporter substrate-binding domain-containing protein n=1 Tax=Ramlibacter sp. 2FC TaxID=2502188 RepID=UPI0010F58C29|nr:transporter substrate-binding domain-containing protein [Ramlibacter sp. 2FC]